MEQTKAPGQVKAEQHAENASLLLMEASNADGPRRQELVDSARDHLNQVKSWVAVTPEAPQEAHDAVREVSAALALFK
jgi:hypothetical protein